jgi:uncharacterized cupin superfamily protein
LIIRIDDHLRLMVVPPHGHPDGELFHILPGELAALADEGLRPLRGADVLDVTDGVRHGWRDSSGVPASDSIDI